MRFHSIEAIALDIPLTRNFGGSTYAVLKRSTVVTRLRTDDGLVSEVYNGDNREHGLEIVRLIQEELAPLLRGHDHPRRRAPLGADSSRSPTRSRDRKTLMEAIACVDCAIWDLVGKARGQSVCALLGGYRRGGCRSSRSAATTCEGKTLADIGREMESYREAGMAGCKFKVGGLTPEADAERVEAARQRRGPRLRARGRREPRLVAWSDAIRFARLVEPLDIRWFEEPCHWHDDAAHDGARCGARPASRSPRASPRSPATRCGGCSTRARWTW